MSPFYGDYRFVGEYVRIEIKMKNIAIKGIKGLGIVILHLLILGLIPLNMYMMNITMRKTIINKRGVYSGKVKKSTDCKRSVLQYNY